MKNEKYLYKVAPDKIKFGLERTKQLLACCNNPEKSFFSIQIAGTNGKGSTAAFLANILYSKYTVGLFTSPHLVDYKERIRINSKKIKNTEVNNFIKKYKNDIEKIKPSFFEIMTAMAMWHFKKNNVNIAILETGLGGRLDSITACQNNIVAFTNIDLDHQKILGKTIKKIALEKAAAITQHTRMVFTVKQKKEAHNVLKNQSKQHNLALQLASSNVKNYNLQHMHGAHQITNAQLAETIARTLAKKLFSTSNRENILVGIQKTRWPGRFQTINLQPTIIFDVAHNNAGIKSFIDTTKQLLFKQDYSNKTLICAFEANKKINQTVFVLNDMFNDIICTETHIKNSMDCKQIAQAFKNHKAIYDSDIEKVLQTTIEKSGKNDLICIIGSHYFGSYIHKVYNKSFAKI